MTRTLSKGAWREHPVRRASCATGSAGRCLRVAPVLESLSKGVAAGPLDCLSVRVCADPVLARAEGLLPITPEARSRREHGRPEAGGISHRPNAGPYVTGLGFPEQGGHADCGEGQRLQTAHLLGTPDHRDLLGP